MEYRVIRSEDRSDSFEHALFGGGRQKGAQNKNHKYLARAWIQNKWRYAYTQAEVRALENWGKGKDGGLADKKKLNDAKRDAREAKQQMQKTDKAMAKAVNKAVDNAADRVRGIANTAGGQARKVADQVSNSVQRTAYDVKKSAAKTANKVIDDVTDKAKGTANVVSGKARQAADNLSNNAQKTAYDIRKSAKEAFEDVKSGTTAKQLGIKAKNAVNNLKEDAPRAAKSAANAAKEAAEKTSEAVSSAARNAQKTAEDVAKSAKKSIDDFKNYKDDVDAKKELAQERSKKFLNQHLKRQNDEDRTWANRWEKQRNIVKEAEKEQQSTKYKMSDLLSNGKNSETYQKGKAKAEEFVNKAADAAKSAADKATNAAKSAADKASDVAEKVTDKMEDFKASSSHKIAAENAKTKYGDASPEYKEAHALVNYDSARDTLEWAKKTYGTDSSQYRFAADQEAQFRKMYEEAKANNKNGRDVSSNIADLAKNKASSAADKAGQMARNVGSAVSDAAKSTAEYAKQTAAKQRFENVTEQANKAYSKIGEMAVKFGRNSPQYNQALREYTALSGKMAKAAKDAGQYSIADRIKKYKHNK